MSTFYYIQNKGFVGNCLLWWGPNRGGYTCDLDKAGKYTKAEADAICGMRKDHRGKPEDIAHEVSVIDSLSVRHATRTEQ